MFTVRTHAERDPARAALIYGSEDAFFDVFWACHRAGLYPTPVNWHLQRDKLRYIVENCDAKVFLAHARFAEVAHASVDGVESVAVSASVGGEIPGFRALEDALSGAPTDAALGEELEGSVMLYSSGTTGGPRVCVSLCAGCPPAIRRRSSPPWA